MTLEGLPRRKEGASGGNGVPEYWIVDLEAREVEVLRREGTILRAVATLSADQHLTSPLLPGFRLPVGDLFFE